MSTSTEHTDRLMASLIEGNVVFLAKATAPSTVRPDAGDEMFLAQCMAAQYAGAAARLLAHLTDHAPAFVETAAAVLLDAMEDGERVADWVSDEAERRGIDIEATIARIRRAAT